MDDCKEMTENKKKSLIDAVEEKYDFDGDERLTIQIFVPKSAPGKKGNTGEIVIPNELSLDKYKITCAGERSKIGSLCKDVTYLDLSDNLISDWSEVFTILDEIPNCRFLNIMANPLKHNLNPEEITTYPCMENLVLNGLYFRWEMVNCLLIIFPNLNKLHLSLNLYTDIQLPSTLLYPSLLSLHFHGNQISHWNEVAKFGKAFPNLEHLVFMNNPIENLPQETEIKSQFPCLKSLNLSDSKLNSWEELEKLNYFPQLDDIRLQRIAFLEIGLPAPRMRIWHEESDGYTSSLEELLCHNLTVSRYDIKENDELLIDEK